MMIDSEVDKYDILKKESIIMIGERYPNRVAWLQVFDTTDSFEESDIRQLLIEVSKHITSGNVPSGSARKFLDGKLIYFEVSQIRNAQHRPRVYAIFTNQVDNIRSQVKKAVAAVATRGGVYSAQRFFSEMVEILEDPEKLELFEHLTNTSSMQQLSDGNLQDMGINELGLLVSHLNQKNELDFLTLERIYFHIYSLIQELGTKEFGTEDPDELLDAAYVVGQQYQVSDNFHLALELYKQMIPVAINNVRFDLETACRLQIATIYKNYFPMSGDYILEILEPINDQHLSATNNRLKEMYFCLLGHAHLDKGEEEVAVRFYKRAINVSSQEAHAPLWIAEAYFNLGEQDERKHYLRDSTRHYLTGATIAFNAGSISLADEFRNHAAKCEIDVANSIIHTALVHRMEMDHKDAEYRAWESLRLMIKAHRHSKPSEYGTLSVLADEIVNHARIILKLPGKERKNREILDEIELLLTRLQSSDYVPEESDEVETIEQLIEENIPIPPPTYMLLSVDGRLMSMGVVTDDGIEPSDIEGTLLSGILSAIMSLVSEVANDEDSSLRTIDAGNFQIMIEQSDNVVAVLLLDRDIQEFRNRLIRFLDYIDENIGEELKFWDGNISLFDPVQTWASELFAPSIIASNMDNL